MCESCRACPGHPRLGREEDVDGRDKPGHDEWKRSRKQSTHFQSGSQDEDFVPGG
jgi:hypothetical protein